MFILIYHYHHYHYCLVFNVPSPATLIVVLGTLNVTSDLSDKRPVVDLTAGVMIAMSYSYLLWFLIL